MIIENAKVYTKEQVFQNGNIGIKDGVFLKDAGGEIIDAKGYYAIPGLIDLHLHGCIGYDFCDGSLEAIKKIAEYELSCGVTGIAPATMTLPITELEQVLSVAAKYQMAAKEEKEKKRADLLGINMEGPFISKAKKGAQDARNIIPCNVETAEEFLKASEGLVKFIGIAPEDNPNCLDFINKMKDKVNISLAHTNADYNTAIKSFKAGANHAVHLFNAMPPFHHREPGVVGAVLDSPHVYAEFICDGIHLHPAIVRAMLSALGRGRVVFISDSMRATGLEDGRYTLGGLEVEVKGKEAILVSDGALAGSVSNLMACMRTAVKQMGVPLEIAIACSSVNPAKCLGVYKQRGSIECGKQADVVLLDEGLNVKMVIKNGNVVCKY